MSEACTILYVGKISDNPSWSFELHKHDDMHEMLYVDDGKGYFTINNQPYTASKGDILIYNQGILHEERTEPEWPINLYYCGFRLSNTTKKNWIIHPEREPVIRANCYTDTFATLIQTLFKEYSIRGEGYEQLSQHMLKSLLILLDRMQNTEAQAILQNRNPLAERIKQFLDLNYRQNLTVKEIADQHNIDAYYLIHLFKNNYGVAPYHYLLQRRMGEATTMLATTNKKIWEIAKLVGYDNPNYFSILFTKWVGKSPRSFRSDHQKTMYNQQK